MCAGNGETSSLIRSSSVNVLIADPAHRPDPAHRRRSCSSLILLIVLIPLIAADPTYRR
jgi:hypothetical protein